jgi:hypothetical protein
VPRVVDVARARPALGDLGQRVDQAVHVLDAAPEPDARAHRARQRRPSARAQGGGEALGLGLGDAEQLRDQRVCAEAAVADADRVLGAQDRRQQRCR